MQCPVKFVRMAGVSCIILAAVMPSGALAYHPLATDDTGTQGLAGNQLELGYDYAHSNVAGVADIGREIPLTFTRGLSDSLDVFAGIARVMSPTAGWGNPGVGLKWRFFENDASKFSLALKPEVRLPVSTTKEAAGLGNGKTSYGLTLIASREIGFGELHFNLAAERDNFDDAAITDRKNRYRLSLAPVWTVAEKWKLALDLGVQTNPDSAERARMGYVEIGMVYSPSQDIDLSLGITHDLMDGPAESTSASLGLTWRFR